MPHQIVIIEDNPHNARLAQKLLRRADPPYEVHMAEDGESGYDMALETNPDLVLVDLGLPDMDGQTVVAMLRQQPQMSKTPIIAFTAWPQETAHEMAAAYGCDGVITKPIDTRNFNDQIKAFMLAASQTDAPASAAPAKDGDTDITAPDPATTTHDSASVEPSTASQPQPDQKAASDDAPATPKNE